LTGKALLKRALRVYDNFQLIEDAAMPLGCWPHQGRFVKGPAKSNVSGMKQRIDSEVEQRCHYNRHRLREFLKAKYEPDVRGSWRE
jgi:hypothetical protein